jgi:hypothetical protein
MSGVEAQALPAFRAARISALCGEATGARLDSVALQRRSIEVLAGEDIHYFNRGRV